MKNPAQHLGHQGELDDSQLVETTDVVFKIGHHGITAFLLQLV